MRRGLSYKEVKIFVQSQRANGAEQRSTSRQSRSVDLDLTCVTPTLKEVLQWPSASSPSLLETSIHSGSHPMLLRYTSSLLHSVSTIQPTHVNLLTPYFLAHNCLLKKTISNTPRIGIPLILLSQHRVFFPPS